MTKDEQEALSRLYSDDVIRLLPLKSGAVAVFNNARDLCGILDANELVVDMLLDRLNGVFYPPKKAPTVDLKELGLL